MRECRCCRRPIPAGMLACKPHWFMLPTWLRNEVTETYARGVTNKWYIEAVTKADDFWKARGIWKPGVPSTGKQS